MRSAFRPISIAALSILIGCSESPPSGAANERNAMAAVKAIATAQRDFFVNDRDGDEIKNYWVRDVAGLYGLPGKEGKPIASLELGIAQADASLPNPSYSTLEPTSYVGFIFQALVGYRSQGKLLMYDDGSGRNTTHYGIVAYPEVYNSSGNLTFLFDQTGAIWHKDTKGIPLTEFPEDPAGEGWTKVQ